MDISIEQVVALLKHRCRALSCDEPLDDAGLLSGDPAACMRILRFLFTRFSEALWEHLAAHGHAFHAGMTDVQLATAIIAAWDLVSNVRLPAHVTAAVLLAQDRGQTDRLLFTLQSTQACCEKHLELAAASRRSRASSVGSEASAGDVRAPAFSADDALDIPRALISAREEVPLTDAAPVEMERRDTMEWMLEAYREQLAALDSNSDDSAGRDAKPLVGGDEPQSSGWEETMLIHEVEEGQATASAASTVELMSPAATLTGATDGHDELVQQAADRAQQAGFVRPVGVAAHQLPPHRRPQGSWGVDEHGEHVFVNAP